MTLVVGVLIALAAMADVDSPTAVRAAQKKWRTLDQAERVQLLKNLRAHRSKELLAQCGKWLREDDPVVRLQVARLVAGHAVDTQFRAGVEEALRSLVKRHMDVRARRERDEFNAVCRKHGRKVPPGDQIAAGRHWKDPYDEKRRALPDEIKAEREFVRELIGVLEATGIKALNRSLMRIFLEHHDPEVVVRVVKAFGKLKEWRTLPFMADLARIQKVGRMMGGADVIGQTEYATARLKWDVHKDRLWWSRPEYMPRVSYPVRKAAGAITGEDFSGIAELDKWLLGNEPKLRAHGVSLTPRFRRRAAESQR